ncbi:AzlD domain-containing protein [Paralimibaculum aggregatum]|uniref:AzlD domain-containing protein n=1 Tax=Paralimibaculum aggregatum TaxID=3036245 RepID=A0ABQ6LR79_9RHOB|nr:AzlD domain-containing protein [Limibaculum sp. NKW23]GMG83455.1 AzlD domain-containing protein [Limibaculum sp. NKW23]
MISDTAIWSMIAGLGIATYAIRFSFLGLLAGREVPESVRRGLAFVPAAVLPALIAPMVVGGQSGADPERLAACAAALVAGLLTRNVLAGILAGIAGYALALVVSGQI